jgi:uncharacterized membrane protein
MRNIRGIVDDFRTTMEEDQALLAVAGALTGIVAALLVDEYGPGAETSTLTITITQARATLLSALALVFTGLSIVLALVALTTGNMASKFSPRFLRMKLRHSSNKWVLSVFVLTASFIITSQILLRNRVGDDLAPPGMLFSSTGLVAITGVVIIVYIDSTLHSLRVDRAIRWIVGRIERAAKRHEHELRHDIVVPVIDVTRPSGAVDLVATENGYVVGVDTGRLDELVTERGLEVVIEAGTGRPVVRGERIGWLAAPGSIDERTLTDILACVAVAHDRDPDSDTGYAIHVLVDIGLMALSPAVNDPQTGVQCAEALTQVVADLAQREIGVRTRERADGTPSVVVIEDTIGDLLDAAGRQLLLYGAPDRTVTAALLRLGRQGERAARSDRDRQLAAAFAADVDEVRAADAGSEGRAW